MAATVGVRLTVIRDQFQHRSAVEFGVPDARIEVFETYVRAARAVRVGHVDANASVGRAHSGFIGQNPDWNVELILVPATQKPPAFGSFVLALNDATFRGEVDTVLSGFLGSDDHRNMVAGFGFLDAEVDSAVSAVF